jgi:hypothetical protein
MLQRGEEKTCSVGEVIALLEKQTELWNSRGLVGELFKNDSFIALLTKDAAILRNTDYDMSVCEAPDYKVVHHGFVLPGDDFPAALVGIDEWHDKSRSFWGIVDAENHRSAARFFPPDVPREQAERQWPSYRLPEEAKTHEVLHRGGLDIIIANAHFGMVRGPDRILLSFEQVPLLQESLAIHGLRSGGYVPASPVDDVRDWVRRISSTDSRSCYDDKRGASPLKNLIRGYKR